MLHVAAKPMTLRALWTRSTSSANYSRNYSADTQTMPPPDKLLCSSSSIWPRCGVGRMGPRVTCRPLVACKWDEIPSQTSLDVVLPRLTVQLVVLIMWRPASVDNAHRKSLISAHFVSPCRCLRRLHFSPFTFPGCIYFVVPLSRFHGPRRSSIYTYNNNNYWFVYIWHTLLSACLSLYI